MKRVIHVIEDPYAPDLSRVYALSRLIDIAVRSGRTDLVVTATENLNNCDGDRLSCIERVINTLASKLDINVVFTR